MHGLVNYLEVPYVDKCLYLSDSSLRLFLKTWHKVVVQILLKGVSTLSSLQFMCPPTQCKGSFNCWSNPQCIVDRNQLLIYSLTRLSYLQSQPEFTLIWDLDISYKEKFEIPAKGCCLVSLCYYSFAKDYFSFPSFYTQARLHFVLFHALNNIRRLSCYCNKLCNSKSCDLLGMAHRGGK